MIPSFNLTILLHISEISCSCVTINIVFPSSFNCCKNFMISFEVFESKAPVGSSASNNGRFPAIARALAGHRPFLLADDPTGNLGIASGKGVLELLKDLCHD